MHSDFRAHLACLFGLFSLFQPFSLSFATASLLPLPDLSTDETQIAGKSHRFPLTYSKPSRSTRI